MKKLLFLMICTLALVGTASAQWSSNGNKIYYNNGNVGVGVSSPATKFHVRGNYNDTYGQLLVQAYGGQHTQAIIRSVDNTHVAQLGFNNYTNGKAWYISSRWNTDGGGTRANDRLQFYFRNGSTFHTPMSVTQDAVGIGTENPQEKLHIYTTSSTRRAMIQFETSNAKYDTYWRLGAEPGNGHTAGQFMLYRNTPGGTPTIPLAVMVNGQVVLGTALKKENVGDPAVRVNGELCVAAAGMTCPDYVFEEDYDRMSLEDLKEYLQENKHLPGVKSAQEVEDQGGIHVVEISYSMLEKIEELTLYTIEQQDELEDLKQMVRDQQAAIESLQANR